MEAQTLDGDTASQDSQEGNICDSLQGPGDNNRDPDLYTKSHARGILCLPNNEFLKSKDRMLPTGTATPQMLHDDDSQ